MSESTFFKVATRPKWILALLLSLGVAAIFASLAQWQADRTYRYVPKVSTEQTLVPLSKIAEAAQPISSKQVDRLVEVLATPIPGEAYVITNRIQLDGNGGSKNGFWLVRPATTDGGKYVLLALGWFATEQEAAATANAIHGMAEDMMLHNYQGFYEPSEDPRPSRGITFDSISIAQLINQPNLPENISAYPGFVIVQQPTTVGEKIVIGANPGETVFNWLTAFYAVEWTLFAGFAVFLWGRLVRDEVNRERSER